MKRYTVVPRWILVVAVVALALLGLVGLHQGGVYLLGPVPDRGETREPTGGERLEGAIIIAVACVTLWGAGWFLRRPRAVLVHEDGTIVIVRLRGRTTLRATEIDAIETKRDDYTVRITHGKRTTSMRFFEEVEAFVVDVRWLNPDVDVTGAEPSGAGTSC